MRRAVLTLGGTVAGLAALFSFKTHVPTVTPVAEPSSPTGLSVSAPPRSTSPTASASASASASRTTKPTAPKASPTTPTKTEPTTPTVPVTTPTRSMPITTTAPATKAPTKQPTSTPTPTPTKSSAPSGTFTGPDVNPGQYGDVQVKITVSNGKITAANDVQPTSDYTASSAVSQLNSEVLQAQSANIQAVSGATYTSNGYISSLQKAVDQAGL